MFLSLFKMHLVLRKSVTLLLWEFMDPSMCYVPNGYSSYRYGGYDGHFIM
ncbi:unnamed protein product, partial [Vitis vinifera]